MYASTALLALLGGFIFLFLGIFIVLYVVSSLATLRVLRIYNYNKTWLAWIPFAKIYGLAEAAAEDEDSWPLFGAKVPKMVFMLSWLIVIALGYISVIGGILSLAARIILYGQIFIHIFSRVENRSESDVQAVGYLSGFINLIAWIKFLGYDANMRIAPIVYAEAVEETESNTAGASAVTEEKVVVVTEAEEKAESAAEPAKTEENEKQE